MSAPPVLWGATCWQSTPLPPPAILSDIAESYGTSPDLCVYAGVPAAMFLANADPEADLAVMRAARENLRKIAPKQVVLVSSIAVYPDSRGKTEADAPRPD